MQKQRGEDEHAGGQIRVQRHGPAAGPAVQVGLEGRAAVTGIGTFCMKRKAGCISEVTWGVAPASTHAIHIENP